MSKVSVKRENGDIKVSRFLGGSFWHVVTFTQQYEDAPWNVSMQELYQGGDACMTYCKKTNLSQPGRSQLEYAYIADGEDVGAYAHGNELLTSSVMLIDSNPIEFDSDGCARGDTFDLTQNIRADVNGPVNDTILIHQIDSSGMRITHTHNWIRNASVGYFYSAMLPINTSGVYDTMTLASNSYNAASFPTEMWTAPAEVYYAKAEGFACGRLVPIKTEVEITPASVDSYAASNVRDASWQINRAGAGWSKLYFERAATAFPVSVSAGDIWTAEAFYNTCLNQQL